MRNNSKYDEAVKHFNRVGGQLKRKHNIDPGEFLSQETKTEKGVQRALDKMRRAAELEDLERDVDDLEAAYDDLEEAAKEADFQDHVDQYEQARETISENWGIDMDEPELEIFWRAFDDPDIVNEFGSPTVLYLGEMVRNDDTVTMKQAAEIAKGVVAQAVGQSKQADEILDDYLTKFAEYKLGRKEGRSHKETIKNIFDDEND